MTNPVTTEAVWNAIEKELFAVLGMVTGEGQSRTVGIVYQVHQRKLYIGTGFDTWKARHISENPHVSLTIPIPKRIPFLPWISIPQATITCHGTAKVIPSGEAEPDLLRLVFREAAKDQDLLKIYCLIEVVPKGDFITYGIGIPLLKMRNPDEARGRALVLETSPNEN